MPISFDLAKAWNLSSSPYRSKIAERMNRIIKAPAKYKTSFPKNKTNAMINPVIHKNNAITKTSEMYLTSSIAAIIPSPKSRPFINIL